MTAVANPANLPRVSDPLIDRFEQCRATLGWSMRAVSAAAGLSQAAYGQLTKRGTLRAEVETIRSIVDAFVAEGFSREWLMTGEGEAGRELAAPEPPLPDDWHPPVFLDVAEQLIELGYPPDRVFGALRGLRFQHKRPPTHLEVARAVQHHLDSVDADEREQVRPGVSGVDPAKRPRSGKRR